MNPYLEWLSKDKGIKIGKYEEQFFEDFIEGKLADSAAKNRISQRKAKQILLYQLEYIEMLRNNKPIDVYCQGTKKIGIPCRRYLGKVEGKAELLCPICKTLNVVENGKVTVKERKNHESKSRR